MFVRQIYVEFMLVYIYHAHIVIVLSVDIINTQIKVTYTLQDIIGQQLYMVVLSLQFKD